MFWPYTRWQKRLPAWPWDTKRPHVQDCPLVTGCEQPWERFDPGWGGALRLRRSLKGLTADGCLLTAPPAAGATNPFLKWVWATHLHVHHIGCSIMVKSWATQFYNLYIEIWFLYFQKVLAQKMYFNSLMLSFTTYKVKIIVLQLWGYCYIEMK